MDDIETHERIYTSVMSVCTSLLKSQDIFSEQINMAMQTMKQQWNELQYGAAQREVCIAFVQSLSGFVQRIVSRIYYCYFLLFQTNFYIDIKSNF